EANGARAGHFKDSSTYYSGEVWSGRRRRTGAGDSCGTARQAARERAALYKASTDHVPYPPVMLSAAPRFHGRPREPEARSRNTPRMCPASMPLRIFLPLQNWPFLSVPTNGLILDIF